MFDANVFINIAKSEILNAGSEELEKVIREYHYVIKSTKLLKHYVGAIHKALTMNAEPLVRAVFDKLESRRPKLTKKVNDHLANRNSVGFSVHSDDHFLYQLAIEARRRHEVLFVSNDPRQIRNSALMHTNHSIPIIESDNYILNYC